MATLTALETAVANQYKSNEILTTTELNKTLISKAGGGTTAVDNAQKLFDKATAAAAV